jgi:hypothetical protein
MIDEFGTPARNPDDLFSGRSLARHHRLDVWRIRKSSPYPVKSSLSK